MSQQTSATSCCGCYGPQGPQGVMGLQGLQGIQGPAGQDGAPGATGAQGVQGPAGASGQMGAQGPQGAQGISGPQGAQGIQGIPGLSCDSSSLFQVYANVFGTVPQTIQPYNVPAVGDQVLFDSQNAVSSTVTDFDLSAMNTTGDIKFLKHGIYRLSWQLQARIAPPIPQPVPSWSFGFWLNGVLIPGSIYSGYTSSPNDDAAHSTGDLLIEVKAGDKLRLRNTCVSPVVLNPNINGSVFPITIATVVIEGLKSLP
jgi:hypothetical protein